MKRYVLFSYGDFYPNGGIDDIHGSYDTLEEAQAVIDSFTVESDRDWNAYIVDRDTWVVMGQRVKKTLQRMRDFATILSTSSDHGEELEIENE